MATLKSVPLFFAHLFLFRLLLCALVSDALCVRLSTRVCLFVLVRTSHQSVSQFVCSWKVARHKLYVCFKINSLFLITKGKGEGTFDEYAVATTTSKHVGLGACTARAHYTALWCMHVTHLDWIVRVFDEFINTNTCGLISVL